MPVRAAVITTIQAPTPSVVSLRRDLDAVGATLIAVGDRKTPLPPWQDIEGFLGIADQGDLGYTLAGALPENHYSRKNLGYLHALALGASAIFDTDDDNAPASGWRPRELECPAGELRGQHWVNVYSYFTDQQIWPRGYPLEMLGQTRGGLPVPEPPVNAPSPIQQSLVDGSPDVDAVWRLVQDREFRFVQGPSLRLLPGAWCPFNSQSTWWFPEAFPLLYLPSHVSFRMTDIWRSLVAQRCLWELGRAVTFHPPDMIQVRNPHDLLRDFEQEVPGYLCNDRIRRALEALSLSSAPDALGDNLLRCYETLARSEYVSPNELPLVELWLQDFETLSRHQEPATPVAVP